MRRFVVFLMLAGLPAGLLAGTAGAVPPADTPAAPSSQRPVCPGPASPGTVRCHAHVVTDANGAPNVTSGPAGLGPTQIQSAYKLPGLNTSAAPTVAIVDAYDDPAAATDLAVFRKQFNLPACTTGRFTKVDQRGGTSYPAGRPW